MAFPQMPLEFFRIPIRNFPGFDISKAFVNTRADIFVRNSRLNLFDENVLPLGGGILAVHHPVPGIKR
jgi:hypothetical protein